MVSGHRIKMLSKHPSVPNSLLRLQGPLGYSSGSHKGAGNNNADIGAMFKQQQKCCPTLEALGLNDFQYSVLGAKSYLLG